MSEAVVRFPNFAARLSAACDEHPDCPPLHKGRQVWLRAQLAREGLFVSVEGIRKWLAGESRPKEENAEKLARVLTKDAHWLRTGQLLRRDTQTEDEKSAPFALAPSLNIGLRPGLSVDIRGLPMDLTKAEAARLGAVLSAWATVG
jgi:hypothetical protein